MTNIVGDDRTRWWREARFGMFLHWGLFSIPARGVWPLYLEHTPQSEYARLAGEFRPDRYDPRRWVQAAQDAGMKYMVLTTRNHDGYCLFDSKTTDYTAPHTAPARDIVGEFAAACHEAGMRMGFYYSLCDWRHPGSTRDSLRGPDEDYRDMVDLAHEQIGELMSSYGQVDILWIDGMTPNDPALWRSDELVAMVRRHQPGILINNRAGLPGDFGTPEQTITPEDRPWEACYTMNDHWGWASADRNWKTPRELLHTLCTTVSRGGNLLLNVGPMPDGRFPAEALERLAAIGAWMRTNGEAIYGATYCPWYGRTCGWNTQRANGDGTWSIYLLAASWPGDRITLGWCGNRVLRAAFVATGEEVRVIQEGDRVHLVDLPTVAPDPFITAIRIDVEGEPRRSPPDNAGVMEIMPHVMAP